MQADVICKSPRAPHGCSPQVGGGTRTGGPPRTHRTVVNRTLLCFKAEGSLKITLTVPLNIIFYQ